MVSSTNFKCIIQHNRDEEQLKACKQAMEGQYKFNVDNYKVMQKKKNPYFTLEKNNGLC